MNMNFMWRLLFCMVLASGFISCSDDDEPLTPKPDKPSLPDGVTEITQNATEFANYSLSTFYLWNKEIADDIQRLNPDTTVHPIEVVQDIRYKDSKGKDIDRWTQLFPNILSILDQGDSTTFGMGLALGRFTNTKTFFFIVTYVYAGSPAEKAGLKRGDFIISLDGEDITESNYAKVFDGGTLQLGMGVQTDKGIDRGDVKSLTSVEMYEDPIMMAKTFDCNGKKVGYLWFNSFEGRSIEKLIETAKQFKSEGVSELILDMRYNGGGDVSAEFVLASLLAPEAQVNSHGVYQKEVYNKQMGGTKDVLFDTEFKYAYYNNGNQVVKTASTQGANLGLSKVYALISGNSASASESILVGLMAFDEIEVEIIGTQSHGKFCTGSMLRTVDVYKKVPHCIRNWGIYVMINRFTDRNGNNPCMPNGLTPDYEVQDDPLDGYQMGDERETLLRQALIHAGRTDLATVRNTDVSDYVKDMKVLHANPRYGMRIDNREMNLPQIN